MYTIFSDVKMTRRKTMCHVADNDGEVVFSGGKFFDALEYLLEVEVYTAEVHHEQRSIRIMLGRIRA